MMKSTIKYTEITLDLFKYPLILNFCFDAILCSSLSNENSDAGDIEWWSWSQVSNPWLMKSDIANTNTKYVLSSPYSNTAQLLQQTITRDHQLN